MILMKFAVIILAMATLAAAVVGAWYWWRSSRIVASPTWERFGGIEPADNALASQMGWLDGALDAARQSAALNKAAAIWTGFAAVLGATATIAGLFAR